MVAPIRTAGGTLLGELRLTGRSPPPRTPLAADATLLAALAELDNELDGMAGALGETEDQLLALYELTKTGSVKLEETQLLHTLVRQATRLVKTEGAFVVLAPHYVVQTPSFTAPEDVLVTLLDRLQESGHELLLRVADLPFNGPPQADSLFLTPLLVREHEQIVACLGLWLKRPAATLSPDLKLARSIAEQGGAQLEIALLHQELIAQARVQAELDLACQVQLSLLPRRPPKVVGIELYAESRPALQVGGDFYDFYAGPPMVGTRHGWPSLSVTYRAKGWPQPC